MLLFRHIHARARDGLPSGVDLPSVRRLYAAPSKMQLHRLHLLNAASIIGGRRQRTFVRARSLVGSVQRDSLVDRHGRVDGCNPLSRLFVCRWTGTSEPAAPAAGYSIAAARLTKRLASEIDHLPHYRPALPFHSPVYLTAGTVTSALLSLLRCHPPHACYRR